MTNSINKILTQVIIREQILIAYSIKKREKMIETIENELTQARRYAIAHPNDKPQIDKQVRVHEAMLLDIKQEIENKKTSIDELCKMLEPEMFASISELIKLPEGFEV